MIYIWQHFFLYFKLNKIESFYLIRVIFLYIYLIQLRLRPKRLKQDLRKKGVRGEKRHSSGQAWAICHHHHQVICHQRCFGARVVHQDQHDNDHLQQRMPQGGWGTSTSTSTSRSQWHQDHNDHLGTCNRERRKEGGERPGAEKKQAAKHLENTGIELFSSDWAFSPLCLFKCSLKHLIE